MSDAPTYAVKKQAAFIASGALALLTLIAFFALFVRNSPGQTLSPGEVRISSRPYQPQSQVLRAESRVVQVGVVVRDGKGRVVSGLKQADFRIYDGGEEQTVSSFSVETRQLRLPAGKTVAAPAATQPNSQQQELPRARYVALYFDDLNTKFGDMRHVQLAAEDFIHTGVSLGDKLALFTASGSGNVDFTPDPTEILGAIEKLKFRGRTVESAGCPRITPYDAYEIATEPQAPIGSGAGSPTYRAILGEAVQCNCIDETNLDLGSCAPQQEQIIRAESKQMWDSTREMSQDTLRTLHGVMDYLSKRPGERVLVLASSGFMTGTLETDVDDLVDNALRAGVVINALDAKGLYTEFPNQTQMEAEAPDLSDSIAVHDAQSFGPRLTSLTAAMADFAVGTGGRYFHNRNDLTAGYYSLAAAPGTEYLLGFAPESGKLNGAFHKLKVEVNTPGKLFVQARPGYFAPTKETKEASGPTPDEKIDAEVSRIQERSDFPLSISEKPGADSKGNKELNVQTHVDIQKLPFETQQDRHVEELTFVASLFNAEGKLVTGKEAQIELALKPESFERFSKSGINGGMSLEAPPGKYRLRVVVQEAVKGEMSAVSQDVQIQ
ncbi:MAG TPA: VWA domain-containing protein [Candidatus Acidoferrales bacterium]|nr:VWA domain-containing protein [Candidatus Acidoferrales bacterium]